MLFLLSACGQQLTKEQVVSKAFEQPVKSFQAKLKTNVKINANGQKMNQSFDYNMKYIKEPFITYLKVKALNGDVELYLDNKKAFILPQNSDQWVKTPIGSVKEFAKLASGESLKKELGRIKKFAELLKLDQKESGYVLNVHLTNSSSKKEKELVMEVLQDAVKNNDLEILKIKKFDYSLTLDENFHLDKITTTVNLDVKFNGQTGEITTKIDADYKNVNSVKTFNIPKEIKQNATFTQLN